MQWIKINLTKLGASEKWVDKTEPLLYIATITIISFLATEIIYRLTQLMIKRLLRIRSYTFLKKTVEMLNNSEHLAKVKDILPDGFTVTDFTYDGQAVQAAADASRISRSVLLRSSVKRICSGSIRMP